MEYKNRMAMIKNKHENTQIDIGALGIDAGLNFWMWIKAKTIKSCKDMWSDAVKSVFN